MAEGRVRIGISGWRYARWRGRFYPGDLPQRRELEYASRCFRSIELNGSFYSLQHPDSFRRWHDETPDDFVFAVKGSRYITHMLQLRGVEQALATFFAQGLLALGAKLGPLLWQLPERARFDPERMRAFLDLLPADTDAASRLARRRDASRLHGPAVLKPRHHGPLRHAFEVRNPGFIDPLFLDMLRERGMALVVADTAGLWPWVEEVTADFMYIRLHGASELYTSGYDDAALDDWARRIRAWRRGAQPRGARRATRTVPPRIPRDVYCYFDNDAKVHAPFDAQRLAQRL
ncbi:DUF72 domain-containing protein [Pseudoxanthomonas suwonensis]|jgi:Uncharacterized conserved protein|uniref:DUF72 domain-containing protein n=1 Tax=Pseudoxanthomonas suwonensis TaxID=314722 RepID=UPI0004632272|nr:DUF72 domain-containing protein [Pseudoxanthomonas suwonensis]